DAVQTLIYGDVEHVTLHADAETAIGRNTNRLLGSRLRRSGRNIGQLLAFRIGHPDARFLQAAYGQVQIALHVHGHAVDAVFRAEIDERFSRSIDETIGPQREGIQLHGPFLGRRARGIDAVGAVVMVHQVERFLVWTQGDAVRLLHVVSD